MTDEDKEQRAFEGEWFALADLLYGRKLREGEPLDEKRMEVSKRAFLMAKAPRLLEAC